MNTPQLDKYLLAALFVFLVAMQTIMVAMSWPEDSVTWMQRCADTTMGALLTIITGKLASVVKGDK